MNAQLRRAYSRGLLEKTAQWRKEHDFNDIIDRATAVREQLDKERLAKARADQQAAKPEIAGSNDVAPQVPGRLAAVQKFLADNKKGIGIGAGVVGGGYLALKIKKMLDERRRRRREEENTALMHPKYAAVRQPRGVRGVRGARGDLRTVKQSSAVKTAWPWQRQRETQYTPSLESVISGVTANRKGQVQLEAERQRLSRVNKERARRQIEEAIAASRDFEDVEKHLKRHLSREQFDAIKPEVRQRSQSLKNTADLRKDQYKIENPGLFARMAVNLFGPKEDAVIKREARKLVASGGVPAVPGPPQRAHGQYNAQAQLYNARDVNLKRLQEELDATMPKIQPLGADQQAPASGAKPDVAAPASGAKPRFKLTEDQKVLGIAALLGLGGYGAYRAFKPKRREDEDVKQSSVVKTAAPAPGPVPEPALSRLGMGGFRALGRYGAVHPARAFVPKPEVAPPASGTNPRSNLTENQKVRVGTALSGLGRGGTALSGLGMGAYRLLRSRPLPRTGAAK